MPSTRHCYVCETRLSPIYATIGYHLQGRPPHISPDGRPANPWDRAPARGRHQQWQSHFPESSTWQPPTGTSWLSGLPEHLQEPARRAAYTVTVLAVSGPLDGLAPEITDPADRATLLDALVRAGLVVVRGRAGLDRWERATQDGTS